MASSTESPGLSKAAEVLLDLLEDDNLRIQRSSSGEIDSEVAQLARELQIRELYVRNEMPNLGSGDLGMEIPESETMFSSPAGEDGHGLAAGCSTPDVLDLVLEMEDDYIMTVPPSPDRMPAAPCSSPVSNHEVLGDPNSLLPGFFSVANFADSDDDFEPVLLKELVNPPGLKMVVEDDGGYEPEVLNEIELNKNILEDDDFDPEIVEEVMKVINGVGDDEVSDFVEFVEEIQKQEESDDDDDEYSKIWPPLPSPMYQFPPLSQALQQRPPLPFQRLPSQASMHRLPPLPFQQLPFVRLQQQSPMHFQELPPVPPLPLQQPVMRPWYPFELHQKEPIQNCSK